MHACPSHVVQRLIWPCCVRAQALIGNSQWSSRSTTGPKLYHVGTIPNAKGNIHAFDLRMMIGSGPGARLARPVSRMRLVTCDTGCACSDVFGARLLTSTWCAIGWRGLGCAWSAGSGLRLVSSCEGLCRRDLSASYSLSQRARMQHHWDGPGPPARSRLPGAARVVIGQVSEP